MLDSAYCPQGTHMEGGAEAPIASTTQGLSADAGELRGHGGWGTFGLQRSYLELEPRGRARERESRQGRVRRTWGARGTLWPQCELDSGGVSTECENSSFCLERVGRSGVGSIEGDHWAKMR